MPVGALTDEPPAPHDPRDGNRPRYRALQSTSAEPGRATPTRRAGCFWSTLSSTRCARGWSVAHIKKGRSSAIDQRDPAEGEGLTPQSKRRCAMARLELEAFFGVRTSRRISDRGGEARRGIAPLEGDAAVPKCSVQQAASYYDNAERAQGGWQVEEIVS